MACGRCECGRRCARRVTQKVGVIQYSAACGTLGRQELVGKVLAWGREAGGDWSAFCVGPVASHPSIYVFGVTRRAWPVGAVLGRAFGRVRLTGVLRHVCVAYAEAGSAFDAASYSRQGAEASIAVVGKARFQGRCASFGEVVWGERAAPVRYVLSCWRGWWLALQQPEGRAGGAAVFWPLGTQWRQ